MSASLPELFTRPIRQRSTKLIAEADKSADTYPFRDTCFNAMQFFFLYREILDGLAKVGFKLSTGIDGTGVGPLVLIRLGGYYLGMITKNRFSKDS
jgi:hypothetical protein